MLITGFYNQLLFHLTPGPDIGRPRQTIVDQYVEKCCSSKMRRLLLKEQNLTTDIIIRIAQAEETLTSQAAQMEEDAKTTSYNTEPETVNRLYNRPRSHSNQTTRTGNSYSRAPNREPKEDTKVCYGCGSQEYILGNNKCRAKGRKCKEEILRDKLIDSINNL